MSGVLTLVQVLLGLAAAFALVRAVRGPNLVDRIVALDLVLLLVAGGLAAHGARDGSQLFVGAVIVVALVAFVGTVLVARFIEWRDG
ncbi:MAG: monovalent cation/H+ antiporter complex subunit F [Acidimicrobiia bacterium]|nr:monovalent cation/H+ antiporter complex subunit F [Acidimicrobiia bacterium]